MRGVAGAEKPSFRSRVKLNHDGWYDLCCSVFAEVRHKLLGSGWLDFLSCYLLVERLGPEAVLGAIVFLLGDVKLR